MYSLVFPPFSEFPPFSCVDPRSVVFFGSGRCLSRMVFHLVSKGSFALPSPLPADLHLGLASV